MTHFQSLDVDGEDSDKERVDKKPVSDQDHDSERAKLPDRALGEESDYSKDGIIRDDLERISSSCFAQANAYSFLHGQAYGRLADIADLENINGLGLDMSM